MLDATVECISRHGLTRTSLSDIAREMGVSPSTVYRKVGSVENAALLVSAREGHRMLERAPEVVAGLSGSRVITAFLAAAVESWRDHPMVAKILRDETEWVGRLATRDLDELHRQGAEAAAPLLAAAMAAGLIRRQDPLALGHWISRIGLTCLVAPPPGDLRDNLDDLLVPMLQLPDESAVSGPADAPGAPVGSSGAAG